MNAEKAANSVVLVLAARVLMLAMPLVGSFGTWLLWEIYTSTQATLAAQAAAISEIQKELQDHENRLDNGKAQRLEFQDRVLKQFDTFSTKLETMSEKLTSVNDTVIRVQTIIETRLPAKSAEKGP